MATVKQFEDLQVGQDARTLVKDIYTTSKQRDFYRDIGLREQIRRAASSTISYGCEATRRKLKLVLTCNSLYGII